MALTHNLCRCGHDRRVHRVFGQPCIACDCPRFTRGRTVTDRGPRLSPLLRRLIRIVRMDR
jgi:hypothetical protein